MGICSEHFSDEFVKKFINDSAAEEFCDYCVDNKKSTDIKLLAEYIEDCIGYEYDDPYLRGAQYDSEANYYEDRFPGLNVNTTEDLLENLLEVNDYQIIDDLSDLISNDYWTEFGAIWGPTKDQYLMGGWENFKTIIKHQVRFLFFDKNLKSSFGGEDGESLNPYLILEEMGKAIVQLNLIQEIPEGYLRIFRGRQHDRQSVLTSCAELGSPPSSLAKANRMSPAGISMFYGAFDAKTCEMEIIDENWNNSNITIGQFVNTRTLKVVDFTRLNAIPSLFDEKNREKRYIASFIISFIKDMSIPVKPDNSVHIDYVPTQVITEYIKIILGREEKIDGILYNSVKNNDGRCGVLFVNADTIKTTLDLISGSTSVNEIG